MFCQFRSHLVIHFFSSGSFGKKNELIQKKKKKNTLNLFVKCSSCSIVYIKTTLTLTIQIKITLNLKHSMNNKKLNEKEKKRKKYVFKKENNNLRWILSYFVGDFYAFRHFDERKITGVFRSALNVVSRNLERESILVKDMSIKHLDRYHYLVLIHFHLCFACAQLQSICRSIWRRRKK